MVHKEICRRWYEVGGLDIFWSPGDFLRDLHICGLIYMVSEGFTTYSLCYVLVHCIEVKFIKNNKLYTQKKKEIHWVYFYKQYK